MSGFSVDWLDLREAADRRARDDYLLEQAMHWLRGDSLPGPSTIVDIGAGAGSTLRAFAGSKESVAATSHWILVDQDSALLAEAQRRNGRSHSMETFKQNLNLVSQLPLEGARLVTASALFDLVSAEFVDALVTTLQNLGSQKPIGLYAALNYDGTTNWTPAHPLDKTVLAAFNRDQRRDKGLGPALGPEACDYLEHQLTQAGFKVFSAGSPWILEKSNRTLIAQLIKGIAAAVTDEPALGSKELHAWTEFRLEHLDTSSCVVGHQDLLALPVPLNP